MTSAPSGKIERALRIQCLAYCAMSLAAIVLGSLFGSIDRTVEIAIIAVLMFLLGIPHGSLDTVFAQRLRGVETARQWLAFVATYLVAAGLVIGLWWLAPAIFLPFFLLISVVHFSGDPAPALPLAYRIVYGGAVIVLPTLLHADEVRALFAFLVADDVAANTVQALHAIAWSWLIATLLAVLYAASSDWPESLTLACTGALAVLADPLLAFAVFFCGMHSMRHILRTASREGEAPGRLMARAAVWPTLACLAAFLGALLWHDAVALEARIMQLLFVGLAALTVPHMILVDSARWRGKLSPWHRGASSQADW